MIKQTLAMLHLCNCTLCALLSGQKRSKLDQRRGTRLGNNGLEFM